MQLRRGVRDRRTDQWARTDTPQGRQEFLPDLQSVTYRQQEGYGRVPRARGRLHPHNPKAERGALAGPERGCGRGWKIRRSGRPAVLEGERAALKRTKP